MGDHLGSTDLTLHVGEGKMRPSGLGGILGSCYIRLFLKQKRAYSEIHHTIFSVRLTHRITALMYAIGCNRDAGAVLILHFAYS